MLKAEKIRGRNLAAEKLAAVSAFGDHDVGVVLLPYWCRGAIGCTVAITPRKK